MDSARPVFPKRAGHVGQCVHSDRVETGLSKPPETVLNEVFFDFGIGLIQIRQDVDKPALEISTLGLIARPRVHRCPLLPVVRNVILNSTVEPRRRWRVVCPWMIRTSMVGYLILNDQHPGEMRL